MRLELTPEDIQQIAEGVQAAFDEHYPGASPWMTVAEAAEYMRASESWVRARLHDIPHVKVDGKTLINRRELDLWLQGHSR